jgi:hypothetical protein
MTEEAVGGYSPPVDTAEPAPSTGRPWGGGLDLRRARRRNALRTACSPVGSKHAVVRCA